MKTSKIASIGGDPRARSEIPCPILRSRNREVMGDRHSETMAKRVQDCFLDVYDRRPRRVATERNHPRLTETNDLGETEDRTQTHCRPSRRKAPCVSRRRVREKVAAITRSLSERAVRKHFRAYRRSWRANLDSMMSSLERHDAA